MKKLNQRLKELKADCPPIVAEAIAQRDLIKPSVNFQFRIIVCTTLMLFPDRLY
ncbi:MAG: hypothetical protein Q4C82_04900 [Eubacteriales bacterium]|nr:hypothetical protein [Eubacteriales bacterium]